jgi:2-oxoglutarate ferredoxin oxidoreductase subunit alpha
MNLGQLAMLVRARYLVDAVGYNHVRGLPLKAAELAEVIGNLVAEAEGIDVDLSESSDTVGSMVSGDER